VQPAAGRHQGAGAALLDSGPSTILSVVARTSSPPRRPRPAQAPEVLPATGVGAEHRRRPKG
jgi:hypothetical protein